MPLLVHGCIKGSSSPFKTRLHETRADATPATSSETQSNHKEETMGQTAIQQRNETPRSGKSRNPQEVANVLASLRQDCNVVAPPGLDGVRLPNGFSVVWSEVHVDTRDARQGGEVYNVGGAYALSYTALCRLADAFGVTWDGQRSGRTDDFSHPFRVSTLAVGSYMGPDGMPKAVSGTNNTDLRDGTPGFEDYRNDDGSIKEKMLRSQRKKIVEISESKARARAFRTHIGLRAMPQKEIVRPWVVFRIQLTGETDDPRTQRMFEMMLFQNAMNARAALYGPPVQALPGVAMQQTPVFAAPEAAPQLGPVPDEYGELPMDEDDYPTEQPYEAPSQQQATPVQQPPPQRGSAPRQSGGSGVWPWNAKRDGDPEKGTPLDQVDDASLLRLVKYYEDKPGDERFRDKNLALAASARDIVASRQGGDDF